MKEKSLLFPSGVPRESTARIMYIILLSCLGSLMLVHLCAYLLPDALHRFFAQLLRIYSSDEVADLLPFLLPCLYFPLLAHLALGYTKKALTRPLLTFLIFLFALIFIQSVWDFLFRLFNLVEIDSMFPIRKYNEILLINTIITLMLYLFFYGFCALLFGRWIPKMAVRLPKERLHWPVLLLCLSIPLLYRLLLASGAILGDWLSSFIFEAYVSDLSLGNILRLVLEEYLESDLWLTALVFLALYGLPFLLRHWSRKKPDAIVE